jgi:thiol-disulfide isomerase/thioredoxin
MRAIRALGALLCLAVAPLPVRAQAAADTIHPARVPSDDAGLERLGTADYRWRLRTLDGRDVSLEDFRGRVVFLNLWATWCPPCVAELASIQALHDSLAGSGVAFLLVSPETRDAVQPFVRRRRLTAPVYLELQPLPAAFDLRALPTTYVVARDGAIVLRHRGAADWDTDAVRRFLRALAR